MKVKKVKLTTYVFIDASNIIYGASNNGWKMDFKKLIKYLKKRFRVNKVFYYAGLDPENKKQLGFMKNYKNLVIFFAWYRLRHLAMVQERVM